MHPCLVGAQYQEFLTIVNDLSPSKDAELSDLGKAVAHIRVDEKEFGTGTMIDEDHMLTAGHVIFKKNGEARCDPSEITVHFDYETPVRHTPKVNFGAYCNAYHPSPYDKVSNTYEVEDIVEEPTASLDYTILKINKDSGRQPNFYKYLSKNIPEEFSSAFPERSLISVVHHPEEKPKKTSLGVVKKIYSGMFEHSAHTEKGSSGAPVCVPKESMNIVGIHLEGDTNQNVNKALTIEEIWQQSAIIQRLLP